MVYTRRKVVPRAENRIDGVTASITAPPNENGHVNVPTPSVQPRPAASQRSARSAASAAEIAQLKEIVQQQNNELAEMRELMRTAGLNKNHDEESRREDEGDSGVKHHKEDDAKGGTFKAFMECKPPTFKGGVDPLLCTRWIRKMNQTFESGNFTKKQQLCYAIRMLEGEALEWWDSVEQTMTTASRESLTWETFAERVKSRYCNKAVVQRAEREFLRLEKGSMSIAKYNTTFTEKLQFTRNLCPDEASMIRRYVEGLPFEYRATVRSKTTIEAAMDEAQEVEDDLPNKDRQAGRGSEKRKWEGPTRSSQKEEGDSRRSKPNYCTKCNSFHRGPCSKDTIGCRRCGKIGHHYTDCKSLDPLCYYCKEMGHISPHCPKLQNKNTPEAKRNTLPKPTARAFQMTVDETHPERSQ